MLVILHRNQSGQHYLISIQYFLYYNNLYKRSISKQRYSLMAGSVTENVTKLSFSSKWMQAAELSALTSEFNVLTHLFRDSDVATKAVLLLAHGSSFGWMPYLLPQVTYMGTVGNEPRLAGCKSATLNFWTSEPRLLIYEYMELLHANAKHCFLRFAG